jgi:ATP-dependent DNA helicase RecG
LVGGLSECRNKSLQKMFQMLGAGDKAGSGLDKIRSSWQAQHWQSPSLRETFRPDRVILGMPLVSMLPEDTVERLTRNFGGDLVSGLIDDEIQTLVTAALEERVTNRRLQEMLTRHRVDISQMLGGLVERGLLEQHGRRRGAYYTIAWRDGASVVEAGGAHTRNNEAHFLHKNTSSLRNDTSFLRNDTSSLHNTDVLQGGQQPARLFEIAEPVRSKRRAAPDLVKRTILALCARDYLSVHQLSELLDRNATGLHTRYINPLLHEGYLVLRFPDKPNHSQQAYRTVDRSSV